MSLTRVAIIGGGLGGLALSLFLSRQGFEVVVYEMRAATATSEGAIMLSPNALRSLDSIGAYDRVKHKGHHFRTVAMRDNEHGLIDKYEMGNAAKYGYDCLRVYRQIIIDELRSLVDEAGIKIIYEKKFSQIVDESSTGVTFAFVDGGTETTDMVIGADGIHSRVRQYLFPDLEPTFSKAMSIICAIPTRAVEFPKEGYALPVSIHGPGGSFVLAPQDAAGSELLGVTQYPTHDRTRAEWEQMLEDKSGLWQMLRENYRHWNTMIQSAIDGLLPDTLSVWPFYTVPKLQTWTSTSGRVLIIGDAAHAIPPAAGQGVNQAFECVHSLSLVLPLVRSGRVGWSDGLNWWQNYRQARVDKVRDLTMEMNRRRLPGWQKESSSTLDNTWLFSVDIERDVQDWIRSSTVQ